MRSVSRPLNRTSHTQVDPPHSLSHDQGSNRHCGRDALNFALPGGSSCSLPLLGSPCRAPGRTKDQRTAERTAEDQRDKRLQLPQVPKQLALGEMPGVHQEGRRMGKVPGEGRLPKWAEQLVKWAQPVRRATTSFPPARASSRVKPSPDLVHDVCSSSRANGSCARGRDYSTRRFGPVSMTFLSLVVCNWSDEARFHTTALMIAPASSQVMACRESCCDSVTSINALQLSCPCARAAAAVRCLRHGPPKSCHRCLEADVLLLT